MNILIVKLSSIGDIIHTMPALVALRREHPKAHISWLVEEAGASLLEAHPALDRVIVWHRREFQRNVRSLRWIEASRGFRDILRQVRDRRYDLVIDFQALLKSGVWVLLSKGKRKVGFGRGMEHAEGSYLFLNERIPAVSMEVHALERGLILLEKIGVPRGEVAYQLPHDAQAEAELEEVLAEANVSKRAPFVALHPMARWQSKLWFNDRFATLADALHERGITTVLSGSKADQHTLDAIAARMKSPCLRFDGRGGLKHLAALCRRADAVVSTDTGPMHLAAAVGTPVVALFGPTAPNRTGPYGVAHQVLQADVPCSPCFKRRCATTVTEEFGCMKQIEVARVVDAVLGCVNAKESTVPRSATADLGEKGADATS